jgi:hypothetical protein
MEMYLSFIDSSKPPTLKVFVVGSSIKSSLSHDYGIFHIPCNNKEMVLYIPTMKDVGSTDIFLLPLMKIISMY